MKTIKNTSIFACLVTLLFISCSSEDDSGTTPIVPTDKIETTLITSKAAYQNANNGDWIPITEVEYDLLATVLNDVSKIGTTDEQYNFDNPILVASSTDDGISFANNNGVTIPANNYCFAFKYYVADGPFPNTTKVKISSTSATTGYASLGSALPEENPTVIGNRYFVLKGSNVSVNEVSYLAIYSLLNVGFKRNPGDTNYSFALNESETIDNVVDNRKSIILYQGLSSSQKQWD